MVISMMLDIFSKVHPRHLELYSIIIKRSRFSGLGPPLYEKPATTLLTSIFNTNCFKSFNNTKYYCHSTNCQLMKGLWAYMKHKKCHINQYYSGFIHINQCYFGFIYIKQVILDLFILSNIALLFLQTNVILDLFIPTNIILDLFISTNITLGLFIPTNVTLDLFISTNVIMDLLISTNVTLAYSSFYNSSL